jgi:Resolvase, N terminal domain
VTLLDVRAAGLAGFKQATGLPAGRPLAGAALLALVSSFTTELDLPTVVGPHRILVVDGYVRCPSSGTWGPNRAAVARWQIARWTEARGWRLGRIFDETPYNNAPGGLLGHAIERVESRESDGIVISRLEQIGNSLTEALAAIERINAAGGMFASTGDGIDLSTPSGRLILRVLLAVRKWELPASHEQPWKREP